jgi:hypothetical protein
MKDLITTGFVLHTGYYLPGGKVRPARKADNLTVIFESTV